MHTIQIFNHIAAQGLAQLPQADYHISKDAVTNPDAILLRSQSIHSMHISESLQAVARAGAGVNNIPVKQLSNQGIPVFNTPGANANAVKELVIASLLIACRNIDSALQYTHELLNGDLATVKQRVEQDKKQFAGFELPGKTLVVIGLGAIGVQVANSALALGMQVIGFDPAITIDRAWQLDAGVAQAPDMATAMTHADFISVHVPYGEKTHHLINQTVLKLCKKSAILLNFARGEIIDEDAIINALSHEQLHTYVCDFPTTKLLATKNVICLPHLGASTEEAETNCAVMAANTLKTYLETGNVVNSVNFPNMTMPYKHHHRITIVNRNIPNMVGQISTILANANHNIINMINQSRDELAYTIVDVDQKIDAAVVNSIEQINGVLRVRVIIPKS